MKAIHTQPRDWEEKGGLFYLVTIWPEGSQEWQWFMI